MALVVYGTHASEVEDDIQWSDTAYSGEESTSLQKTSKGSKQSKYRDSGRGSFKYGGKDMVTILSGSSRRKWVEHCSVFAEQSAQFRGVFAFEMDNSFDDPLERMKGLVRIPGAPLKYRLSGVSDWEFDSLMWGLKPRLDQQVPSDRLCSMLVLATDWGFTDLRKYAMCKIPTEHMDPIKKVELARKTNVTTWVWLRDPYVELCVRLPPIGYKDGLTLGMKTVAAINLARARILQRRLELVRGEYPAPWMGTNFWHSGCWRQMVAMWSEIITQSNKSHGPKDAAEAMKLALAKKKAVLTNGKPAKPLCKSCDNEALIEKWLELSKDGDIAKQVLKRELVDDLEGLETLYTNFNAGIL